MKKSWVIWTVVPVLLGGLALAAVVIDIHSERRQIAAHKDNGDHGVEEYLQQYYEWSVLSPEERIENPWGQGKYGGAETREKLIHRQRERLKADLPDLASGTTITAEVADVIYGQGWQKEVEKFRRRSDTRDAIAVIGTMAILGGIIVCIGFAVHHNLHGHIAFAETEDSDSEKSLRRRKTDRRSTARQKRPVADDLVSEIIASAREEKEEAEDQRPAPAIGAKSEAIGYFREFGAGKASADRTLELKNTLRDRAAGFQTADTPTSGGGALGTLMSSSPVATELTELTQEVSAIREFAAKQQDRVRQLQDGYDWGIIKRFCLRIIRCIDNLDERINCPQEQGPHLAALLDVRDELVFSLESSGVEQFQPEINSDYKGLEKTAEAVKTRVPAPSPDLVGKIADIVRPGYRYSVSDEDVKIVRCAQVKIYSESLTQDEEAKDE